MAEKNSQKIPGLDRLEDELFINNDSSSIDSTDIDDEFDRLLNEFINNELKDVETPEPTPAAPQTKPQPSKAKNQAPAISEKTSDRQFHKLAPDEEAVSALPKALREKIEISPETGTLTVKNGATSKQLHQISETFKQPEAAKSVREKLDTALAIQAAPPVREIGLAKSWL